MGTTVTYNTVDFSQVSTEGIDHSARYDAVGRKDPILHDVTVAFRGVVHVGNTSTCGHATGTSGLGEGLDNVTRLLSMPRRDFLYKIDDYSLYDIRPAESAVFRGGTGVPFTNLDLDNGPRPELQVLKVINSNSAWVRLTVHFSMAICDDDDVGEGDPAGITNISWSVVDDIDCRTWLTTRHYRGVLRQTDRTINPHRFRHLTWPPLVKRFKRESVTWDDSGDQMSLTFEIIDQEWKEVPPPPFSDWHGVNTVSSPVRYGVRAYNDMRLTLTAPANISQAEMIFKGTAVCLSKVDVLNARLKEEVSVITNFEIQAHHGKENTVELQFQLESFGDPGTSMFNLGAQTLGRTIAEMGVGAISPYDGETAANVGPTSGIAGILAVHTLGQNVCNPYRIPEAGSPLAYIIPSPVVISGQPVNVGRQKLPSYSTTQRKGNGYGYYHLTSEIHYDTGQIALPCGQKSDPSNVISNVILQLYQPRVFRRLMGEAERLNKQPESPPPDKSFKDENGILHTPVGRAKVIPSAPQTSADGRFTINRVDFDIMYALDRPPKKGEKVAIGRVPYDSGKGKHYDSQFAWPEATWIAAGGEPDSTPDDETSI